jgi:hypothetical protein
MTKKVTKMNAVFLNDDDFFKSHVLTDGGRLLKGRVLPEGTIREWNGKKFRKIAGKWLPVADSQTSDSQKTLSSEISHPVIKQDKTFVYTGTGSEPFERKDFRNGYPRYVSVEDISRIKNKQKTNLTIKDVSELAVNSNIILSNDQVLKRPLEEVWKYREFKRVLDDNWVSNDGKTSEEFKKDLSINGIKEPVIIRIEEKEKGEFAVYLTEGNHRLQALKELGKFDDVPIRFDYSLIKDNWND